MDTKAGTRESPTTATAPGFHCPGTPDLKGYRAAAVIRSTLRAWSVQAHRLRRLTVYAALTLAPVVADAQSASQRDGTLLQGALHPLSGLDQLLVTLGIGMWSAQQQGRLRWLMPLCFASVIVASAVLACGSPAPGGLEQALAAAVLLGGLFLAGLRQTKFTPAMLAAGLFALLQGFVRGAACTGSGNGAYPVGFTGATLLVGAAGYGLAELAERLEAGAALRLTGGAVAVAGLAMSVV